LVDFVFVACFHRILWDR